MSERAGSPFSAKGVLALVVVGFAALLAILYFLSIGDTGPQNRNNGAAHASAKGLNGYSALAQLIEADGYSVVQSRSVEDLRTSELLVLTPPHDADPDELLSIIEARDYLGPTLVILPKWTTLPSQLVPEVENPDEVGEGWVALAGTRVPAWANAADGLLALKVAATPVDATESAENAAEEGESFQTLGAVSGLSGILPSRTNLYAAPERDHAALVAGENGRILAAALDPKITDDLETGALGNWLVFVIEPDLMNNWGLADPVRAQAALSIVRAMGEGDFKQVTFDLTLNGFGGAINLLTLAFQPPFLAATLCLVLALLIVAWRAFLRFGPTTAPTRETAFGKSSLVTNGADLIVRAGRLSLLARPYIALCERRLKGAPSYQEDNAFEAKAEALRRAKKPAEILRAARALYHQSRET
ncbi:MAG: DUF4350 domain-containing protein [Erythrobacter sp.]|nr:DUF4350 domain-containing protein [Erythrobacter sp.]